MEVANTMYYNDFSLKLIEDALYELSRAKLSMGERYFVIKTGEMGALYSTNWNPADKPVECKLVLVFSITLSWSPLNIN